MRGITLGVFSAQPTYDVDFQTNVLDVAQTMGYAIPSLEKRMFLDQLMRGMKDIGFFQLQDTLANFALGIPGFEQFRMIDWKLTGNIYAPYGGLIYNTEGIEGNRINSYVSTNFNPATMGVNYTLDDASRGYVVRSGTNNIIETSGENTTNNRTTLSNSAAQRINQGTSNINISAILTGDGFTLISRKSQTDIDLVKRDELFLRTAVSTVIHSDNQILLRTQSVYSDSTMEMYFMGAAVPFSISQSFRTIYNKFLSDSGLSPIA